MTTLLLFALGCSSVADEESSHLKKIASWDATAAMVGEAWSASHSPTPYSVDALQSASDGISDGRKQLEGLKKLSPSDRARDETLAAQSAQLVNQLSRVVQRGDRGAAHSLASRLESAGEAARALSESLSK